VTADAADANGPFVVTFEPAEIEAAAARYGLRQALSGRLTVSHQAPLAALVLTLLFASILALAGLIPRRAGEIAVLIAASAYMVQRLVTHRRFWRARNKARDEFRRLMADGAVTATIVADGVTQSGGASVRKLAFADCEEAEEAGGLVYLWSRDGGAVVVPSRIFAEGEAARLVAGIRSRIGRTA
jgi:hypothetical protein